MRYVEGGKCCRRRVRSGEVHRPHLACPARNGAVRLGGPLVAGRWGGAPWGGVGGRGVLRVFPARAAGARRAPGVGAGRRARGEGTTDKRKQGTHAKNKEHTR